MRIFAYCVSGAALAVIGCSPSQEERYQQLAAEQTRDPASARFKDVRTCPQAQEIVTGEINAKNAFGAYIGFTPFFVDRGAVVFADRGRMSNPEGQKVLRQLAERCGV